MKKLLFLLLSFCFSLLIYGQTPKTISYQGVARNATGQPIPNQSIKIKLSLLETATSSNSLYTEIHTPTTTAQGLFSLQIGAGTVLSGIYANLNWSNGPKFVKTEIDPTGGNNFTLNSTNPLNAVPFALHAENGESPGNVIGEIRYWNGNSWIGIQPGISGQTLSICNGIPIWGPCPSQNLPIVVTSGISLITTNSAIGGGNVTSEGGSPVISKGVCWSTASNPTIALTTKTIDGSGLGVFSSSITGLNPGQTYYLRAYATNSSGTIYGNEISFNTLSNLAALITLPIYGITSTTALSGGTITNQGNSSVTVRGVCWGTNPNPNVIQNAKTINGAGLGTFNSNISGLIPNTTYYLRSYATNANGTSYGNEIVFSTTNQLFSIGKGVFDIDGNFYPSVIIGFQEWMGKNLRTTRFSTDFSIPNISDNSIWDNLSTPAWCHHSNNISYDTIYGKLYNWFAVDDPKKLCPTGWHVPSEIEWSQLSDYLGGNMVAGGKLKAVGDTYWGFPPNTGATNSSGFTGLGAGSRSNAGIFNLLKSNANWWTSTAVTTNLSRSVIVSSGSVSLFFINGQQEGFSVRCLKD